MTAVVLPAPTILAVDGGNSKADVALVAADGRLIGAVRGPTISHQATSIDVATERLIRLAAAASGAVGTAAAGGFPALAMLCVAGADYPTDVHQLERAFGAAGIATAVVIANDTFAALRAGSHQAAGIALICGQGINGAAVSADGRRVRFAGIGDLAGDWGGGGSVGMAGLGAAVRARDGRGPRTALERTIPAAVGLARPATVTHAYYTGRLDERRIGELAPIVFETAAGGDAVARSIVDRLADELAAMAIALARRAGLVRRAPEIVLAGSVFRTADDAFHRRLAERIEAGVTGARIVRLSAPPVTGAALLGLERLTGRPVESTVEARLRAALEAWSDTPRFVTPS